LAIIALIVGLESTPTFPWLYWPTVVLIYLYCIYVIFFELKRKVRRWIARTVVLIILVGLYYFTFEFVFAKVDLSVDSSINLGNYPAGTAIADELWNNIYEDSNDCRIF
jgi:hypothetical protein